jgi:hypothetical protein
MFRKGLSRVQAQLLPLTNFISWSLLFAIIYAQSPLYTSNQNQYFLHGLANVGYGELGGDWLANSIDPTPIFSLLVGWSYRLFKTGAVYYAVYALLFGVYLWSMLGIAEVLFRIRDARTKTLVFLVLFLTIHSAGLRYLISRALGPDWTYTLEGGVAGQRLLGTVLQPSAFGVFLLLSISLYLRGKIYPAILSMIAVVYFHPTYLLSAAMLTLAFMWDQFRERRNLRKCIQIGAIALLLILPVLGYVYLSFISSSPESVARAREILVEIRIPHHALIAEWFNTGVLLQALMVAVAIWLVRRTKLFRILLVLALLGLGLTGLQAIINSNAFALLFPWRISVLLVPLSASIIIAKSVSLAWDKLGTDTKRLQKEISIAGMVVIVLLTLVGATRFRLDWERKVNGTDMAMMGFVRDTRRSGDVYLVPTKMQEFRLETGAPIYVDFKSIPYAPEEVLEWRRRVLRADRFYREKDEACEALESLAREGVTHVVSETGDPVSGCDRLIELYSDKDYAVSEIRIN